MLILEALSEQPPVYAHVPLLHGPDGKKLSKRHGAASVQELRDAGYLPEAVRNYLALLGWGLSGGDETFFSTEQLQREFALERVSRSPAIFDEQKLRWMNGRYVRELPVEELQRRLEERHGRELRRDVVEIAQEKISTLDEFWPLAGFFFDGPAEDPAAREKVLGADDAPRLLREARTALESLGAWEPDTIEAALREVVEREGVKPKHVFQPVRVALAGATISPGIFETVAVMGRDETLARIDAALTGSPV
jgi:glutamyl/glutaminyl-tRNA synthetase